MSKPLKYAVFGAGSWATAIVKMFCENLDEIGWYMRSTYTKEHLLKEQHNPSYLSSVEFNTDQLKLSNDMNEIADWADILVFVIPSAFIHAELEKLTVDISNKTIAELQTKTKHGPWCMLDRFAEHCRRPFGSPGRPGNPGPPRKAITI